MKKFLVEILFNVNSAHVSKKTAEISTTGTMVLDSFVFNEVDKNNFLSENGNGKKIIKSLMDDWNLLYSNNKLKSKISNSDIFIRISPVEENEFIF